MAKVYILQDTEKWMPPIRDAMKRAGVPFEEIELGTGAVDVSSPAPAGVYLNRASVSAFTRGNGFATEHARSVVHWAEANGRVVLGGSAALALESSKVKQDLVLKQYGVPAPHTTAVFGSPEETLKQARARFAAGARGVVIKPNFGGSGHGVQVCLSLEQAEAYITGPDYTPSTDGVMLVQDYVAGSEDAIYRLEFIGGKFHYAVRTDTSAALTAARAGKASTFNNCAADACQAGPSAAPAASTSPAAHPAPSSTAFRSPYSGAPVTLASLLGPDAGRLLASKKTPIGGGGGGGGGGGARASSGSAAPAPASAPAFRNCTMSGPLSKFRVLPSDWTHSVVPPLEAIMQAYGVGAGAVEVVIDVDGTAWVIDMNVCNTNYNVAAEKQAGLAQPDAGIPDDCPASGVRYGAYHRLAAMLKSVLALIDGAAPIAATGTPVLASPPVAPPAAPKVASPIAAGGARVPALVTA